MKATLTGNPPPGVGPYDDDISDNVAEVCLGAAPPGERVALRDGTVDLFTWYDCVGKFSAPCDVNDSLELVALSGSVLQPSQIVVQITDPVGRAVSSKDNDDSLVWSTGHPSFTGFSQRAGVGIRDNTTDLARDEGWGVDNALDTSSKFGLVNTTVSGPGDMSVWYEYSNAVYPLFPVPTNNAELYYLEIEDEIHAEFTRLGTYELTLTAMAAHSGGNGNCDTDDDGINDGFCDTETYTFHVGPMAELEVRGGGAAPTLSTDQYALTVVALNNLPDSMVEAQVAIDLSGLPAGVRVADYIASEGTYTNGTWDLGELEFADSRRSQGKPEGTTLTLILAGVGAANATATASIANVIDDYAVCIDDEGEDLDHSSQTACEADTTNGGSWHSTPVYDYNDSNNEVTLTAQAGTGGVGPEVPANPRTEIAWGFVAFQWDGMAEGLYYLPVSHYETQQRASGSAAWGPLTTVSAVIPGGATGATSAADHNDVQGTSIVDLGIGAGETREYRVRAVNVAGVPGPWSFPVGGSTSEGGKPTAPRAVTAAPDGATAIDVSWTAPLDGGGSAITRYEVQWSEDGQGNWRRVGYTADGATLTLKHSGLSQTTERYYRVRARNSAGDGPWSQRPHPSATTLANVPGIPRNFRAVADGARAINLTWAAPSDDGGSDIIRYDLEWSANGNDPWTALASPGATETAYTDAGLEPGDQRYYRIRAVNGATPGEGSWSPVRRATTGAEAPDAPQGLDARADGDSAIDVTWDPPSDDGGAAVTRYEVAWSASGQGGWSRLVYTTETETRHRGLSAGMERHYRVRAQNSAGWGPWSEPNAQGNHPSATTLTDVPAAPGSFRATANGSSEINLSWTEPDDGGAHIQFYEVQWSANPSAGSSAGPSDDDWTRLAMLGGDATTHIDDGLTAGTTRHYRVRARNFNGPGAWSVTRSATTSANTPTDVPEWVTVGGSMSASEDAIDLEWRVTAGGGEGITGYWVERSRDGDAPWERLRSGGGTGTSYRDAKNLYRGMTRYYRVAAVNRSGGGPWSEVIAVTTAGEASPPPGWVGLLRFTSVGSRSVGLAWNEPEMPEGAPPVTAYEYQVAGPGGPGDIRKTTGRSVSVSGLNVPGDYSFSVRAVNAVVGGPWETLTAYMNPSGSGSVTVTRTTLTVTEGGSASYTVRLSSAPPQPVLLNPGTAWFTGMSFVDDDEPYGVVLTPSGWTVPEDCASLERYTFRTWSQGVTVALAIEDDDIDTGDEVGVFTHEVYALSHGELCMDRDDWMSDWGVDYDKDDDESPSAYHPYRVGPSVLVTRRDND